ncbi:DoxX family protein [Longimicrobium terrae]|uniref:Putative membrane protein YphA (DoxX/SURF4 family) n=1 Tax=Longimicrobium terrae TaxID=1639882 RepID=A0A841GUH3_9BACT|nr:DoxX family protein [Longimicrobium terrae]MBB4636033.1 putative membrane protein YphA (DoxX/SURF4 family) [Longimicrobium terrae]MBB6070429.1 putative membrane protein YphA (DoxX/SURF4 family) [Longimicrobium terrae]NNC30923.1 DoxX family protein [Longimicrobium terrae]
MPAVTLNVPARRSRALHVTLWIVQVLLAVFFLMAGANHGLKPIAEAAQSSPWITGVPVWLARFIGFAELAGAVGLVLPAATRVMPWLTPLAAAGLAVIMALAVPFHVTRGEAGVIAFNIIPALLAAFVAWGRTTRVPIAPRSSRA